MVLVCNHCLKSFVVAFVYTYYEATKESCTKSQHKCGKDKHCPFFCGEDKLFGFTVMVGVHINHCLPPVLICC